MGSHNHLQYLCQNMFLPQNSRIPTCLCAGGTSAAQTNIPGSFPPGIVDVCDWSDGSSRTLYGCAAISQA